jgi:hypothetical protein
MEVPLKISEDSPEEDAGQSKRQLRDRSVGDTVRHSEGSLLCAIGDPKCAALGVS